MRSGPRPAGARGGFHPDLTGLENLVTGGILSGFSEREARARSPQIVAFAELEEFIDQPVRTYSTGMYLRLAFSTAMHFDPAVLVVDEVLAVGDARFQQKCLDHVRSFRSSGGTLVLTSHAREQIKSLCDEVFVLEEGRLVLHADPDRALECYTQLLHERTQRRAELLGSVLPVTPVAAGLRHGTQEASLEAVRFRDRIGTQITAIDCGRGIAIEIISAAPRRSPTLRSRSASSPARPSASRWRSHRRGLPSGRFRRVARWSAVCRRCPS